MLAILASSYSAAIALPAHESFTLKSPTAAHFPWRNSGPSPGVHLAQLLLDLWALT